MIIFDENNEVENAWNFIFIPTLFFYYNLIRREKELEDFELNPNTLTKYQRNTQFNFKLKKKKLNSNT
jgi:hypothetical protein